MRAEEGYCTVARLDDEKDKRSVASLSQLRLATLMMHHLTSSSLAKQTRIQVSPEYASLGMGGTVKRVVSNEGALAMWKGVNAAWLREASYTSLRLGLYEPCKIAFGCTTPENTTFLKKFAAGSAAGALGSIAGNPFDVLKVRGGRVL